jgi:hypothetical protein
MRRTSPLFWLAGLYSLAFFLVCLAICRRAVEAAMAMIGGLGWPISSASFTEEFPRTDLRGWAGPGFGRSCGEGMGRGGGACERRPPRRRSGIPRRQVRRPENRGKSKLSSLSTSQVRGFYRPPNKCRAGGMTLAGDISQFRHETLEEWRTERSRRATRPRPPLMPTLLEGTSDVL